MGSMEQFSWLTSGSIMSEENGGGTSLHSRPPEIDVLGDSTDTSQVLQNAVRTPDSSSASTTGNTNTPLMTSTGGINEFAMYQRFRLQMVKMFGSIASALYEFGADQDTGKLSRKDFVDVLAGQLKLFTIEEASVLFSHATNADPMEQGIGGYATFRDFSITEDEWKTLVAGKMDSAKQNPFTSGPSGGSLGIYHRPLHLTNVMNRPASSQTPKSRETTPKGANSKEATPKANSKEAGADDTQTITEEAETSSPSRQQSKQRPVLLQPTPRMKSHRRVKSIGRGGARVWPWQLPQKPWAPCVFAGSDIIRTANNPEFRNTDSFSKMFRSSRRERLIDQPRHSQLGPTERPLCQLDEASGHLLSGCPSGRAEMEPIGCMRQVAPWWPYERPAPPPRLPAMLPKRPPTGQLRQLSAGT
mmetsp:Transcript_61326/g.109269  ORF Transcript_61326/g.109269 Transcript_61326/m.109269 type:complete len:416 (-) Transcript_61326:26-1273(-)